MRYVKTGIVPYLEFELFDKYRETIGHGISTRAGGVSTGHLEGLNLGIALGDSKENLAENYRRFSESVGFDLDSLVLANQDHTDQVLVVKEAGKGYGDPVFGVDGFITDIVDVPLMVRFADCQGVLMFDPVKRVIASVHSGWRGNVQNIIGKTVGRMVKEFGVNPGDLLVGISQSLGKCHAEFSDPIAELPEEMHKFIDGKFVDLWACSMEQLLERGVLEENVEMARRCTVCENDEFFSFRGGKKLTGHMGGVIWLR